MSDSLELLTSALVNASDDGQTVGELCAKTGHHRDWVCKRLRALQERGQLIVGKRQITDLAGRSNFIPVYKIVEG